MLSAQTVSVQEICARAQNPTTRDELYPGDLVATLAANRNKYVFPSTPIQFEVQTTATPPLLKYQADRANGLRRWLFQLQTYMCKSTTDPDVIDHIRQGMCIRGNAVLNTFFEFNPPLSSDMDIAVNDSLVYTIAQNTLQELSRNRCIGDDIYSSTFLVGKANVSVVRLVLEPLTTLPGLYGIAIDIVNRSPRLTYDNIYCLLGQLTFHDCEEKEEKSLFYARHGLPVYQRERVTRSLSSMDPDLALLE